MKEISAVALGLVLAACAGSAPRVDRPEEAASRLESLAQFRQAFNEHPARQRVLALASPS